MAITRKDLRQRLGGPGFLNDFVGDANYEVHRIFPLEDKNNAINEAIREAGIRWPRQVEDATLLLANSTYTYGLGGLTIPIDPELGVDQVFYDTGATGTGYPFAPLDDDFWWLRQSGTTYTLQLLDIPITNKYMRILYRVRPSTLTDDVTSLAPDSLAFSNYICAKAAALLLRNPIEVVDREQQRYYNEKHQMFEELAESIYNQDRPQVKPGKVILPTWGDTVTSAGYTRNFPSNFGGI